MDNSKSRKTRRIRRKTGIRKRLLGTPERPRLTIYRSLNHIYAQIIDDTTAKTLVSASSIQDKLAAGGNADAAKQVGTTLAERAKAAGVTQVAVDRNGFKYHGRVKALADAAREGGLSF